MDIAIAWNAETQSGDWTVTAGDLTHEDGLRSAILVSLLTDRRANDDDILPDPRDTDRRGWWGDPTVGSRLWLLARAKANVENLRVAEGYVREAMQWMLDERVATSLAVTCNWQGDKGDQLAIHLVISRGDGDVRFDLLWARELAR